MFENQWAETVEAEARGPKSRHGGAVLGEGAEGGYGFNPPRNVDKKILAE